MRNPILAGSFVVVSALVLWPAAALANMEDIVACRNISDDTARLACFDAAVNGVQEEMAARDEELEQERDQRSFFGLPSFSVPNFMTRQETTEEEFGQTSVDRRNARDEGTMDELEEEAGIINEITAEVVEYGRNGFNQYFFVLENGHVWRAVESRRLPFRSNRTNTVRIRRGRMGSFFVKVNDVNAEFRVERIR